MDIYEQLTRDEGVRNKAYLDTVGKLTIGVGHNLDAKGISARAIRTILEDDVMEATMELVMALPWATALSGPRFGVLVNMSFNLGIAGLVEFKKMLAAIHEGRWEDARKEMLDSKYALDVGPRAHRLGKQLVTNVWQ